jgi:hypothetical protein
VLKEESPEAYFGAEAFESNLASFDEMSVANGAAAAGLRAAPVILTMFVPESEEHADPEGTVLARVAKNLARQLPTYQSWGFEDMGVWIGWSCVPQTTPGGTYTRTPEQEQLYLHVLQELPIWISHKLTTIYQIHDQQV